MTVLSLLDGIPVVGHAKGVVHYICTDVDGGNKAMRASSRTSGVVIGGAVGVLGGPAGAVAGAAAGGAVMDLTISAIERKPAGLLKNVVTICEDPSDLGNYVDMTATVACDSLGAVGTKGKAIKDLFGTTTEFVAKRAIQSTTGQLSSLPKDVAKVLKK